MILKRLISGDKYMKYKLLATKTGFMRTNFFTFMAIVFVLSPVASSPGLAAYYNTDFDSNPPFISTYVKPNVLFVLDNSNSMDEDVNGEAVGSDAVNSKSEIARNAIEAIIAKNKETMRFGLMAYKQSNISSYYLHNTPYYCDYNPANYDSTGTPTPKDPTSNTKRTPNPTDPGQYTYYDTALPMYAPGNYGSAFCYSDNWVGNHYQCYHNKTGQQSTPQGLTNAELEALYGYSNFYFSGTFNPTDSDYAAGFDRFGLEMSWTYVGRTWYSNSSPGPGMLHSAIADSSAAHITDLNNLLATSQFSIATDIPLRNAGLTPLSGTIESARKYFEGELSDDEAETGVSRTTPVQLRCQQNFVVLVTDGLPSTDEDGDIGSSDDLLAELEDKITALRSTSVTGFTNDFDIQTYVIGFAIPEEFGDKLDALAVAGGTDIDGKALLANNAEELAAKLQEVFIQISAKVSSGTSASVISNTRSGEGAIYQSVFYPERTDSHHNTVNWVGQLHALLIDDYGNIREDTNQNGALDWDEDLFIVYNGDTVDKYLDGVVGTDGTVIGSNGKFDDYERAATPVETGYFDSIKYLWSSSAWLNNDSLFDELSPRTYTDTAKKRYIFTFIDDGDMLAESGEIVDFSTSNAATIGPYLHVFDPFVYSAAAPPAGIDSTDFTEFVNAQIVREIKWVRGEDQAESAALTHGSVIPAMRSRYYQEDDGADRTWRMGDIVDSTPTVVGRPAENFDLLYQDRTYSSFYSKYKDRRNVVYVGSNDGMFHAFNAGFYDKNDKAYLKRPKVWNSVTNSYDDDTSKVNFDLGAEMWAYIPQNLLPHLYWLTKPDYKHVYYNDLKPKVFDANIFPNDTDHPGGWGTVLVGGMRFGGGKIEIDRNKNGSVDTDDKTMTSAYFIFDVTNPEGAPKLLAEFTLPGLGFTTNYPSVVTLRDKGWSNLTSSPANNDWYLMFGSGPASVTGEPDTASLDAAVSSQNGKIFMLNLNKLGSGTRAVCFLNAAGSCVEDDLTTVAFEPEPLVTLDDQSFISDSVGVDWDIDFKNDAIYFGTVSFDTTDGWGGKLRRIVIDDDLTVSSWDLNSTFIDLSPGSVSGETTGQPITAAVSAALDKQGNRWLYFGTGRYFTAADVLNTDQQSYYGLKEPRDSNGDFLYSTLNRNTTDLFNSTDVTVYEGGGDVKGIAANANYSVLQADVRVKKGWFMDFEESKERNIGQATLLGNILTFTTFVPSADPCESGGESWVYVLDYETGTASQRPVIGTDWSDVTTGSDNVAGKEKVLKREIIGDGLATSPGLHTGRESGTKAFIQSSTGEIQTFEEKTPGRTKSGMSSWQVE